YFKFGAMNSGKSIEIVKVAHNYEEQNKPVKIFTSAVDTRTKVGLVASRTGLEREATPITDDMDLYEEIAAIDTELDCILIDEANTAVMAFGLNNDLSNGLFEGSKYVLIYADKIEELKTICWYCHRKATMNLRINDGEPVDTGEQIQIGGNESYLPVCRSCYHNPGGVNKL